VIVSLALPPRAFSMTTPVSVPLLASTFLKSPAMVKPRPKLNVPPLWFSSYV
jgi:hypothetical protein